MFVFQHFSKDEQAAAEAAALLACARFASHEYLTRVCSMVCFVTKATQVKSTPDPAVTLLPSRALSFSSEMWFDLEPRGVAS